MRLFLALVAASTAAVLTTQGPTASGASARASRGRQPVVAADVAVRGADFAAVPSSAGPDDDATDGGVAIGCAAPVSRDEQPDRQSTGHAQGEGFVERSRPPPRA